MKRSDFVKIVNAVLEEERETAFNDLKQILDSNKGNADILIKLLVEANVRSAEVAAMTTGKIIEKLGLVDFEN